MLLNLIPQLRWQAIRPYVVIAMQSGEAAEGGGDADGGEAGVAGGGVGTAVAFGRLGAILVGYAGPWALEYRGSESFFWLMGGALVVTSLSLAAVRRHVPAS